MNFIRNIRKIKINVKELLKILNMILISSGIVISIILIKYKPMYGVKISGEEIGYVNSKKALSKQIEENIENYSSKSIAQVQLKEEPEYEFKLVDKSTESTEDEIVIALQKDLEITYKYYEIELEDEVIENVDTIETAEQIVEDVKTKSEEKIVLTINEKTTENIEEVNTNTLEVAESNVIDKLDLKEGIAEIEGIKIATLPVTGTISSRYGAVSSVRSSSHTGLDISAKTGTPIKVVANGTVTFAAYSGSYGYVVKVDHGNGISTWYAHTSKMYVKAGDEVKAGDVIAAVGSTGNSTGSHLHFEVRINGQHVNPQKYLYK